MKPHKPIYFVLLLNIRTLLLTDRIMYFNYESFLKRFLMFKACLLQVQYRYIQHVTPTGLVYVQWSNTILIKARKLKARPH